MTRLEYKEDDGDSFSRDWHHLDRIPKGSIIATRSNGQEIVASENVVILLPKHAAKAGQEWFYVGKIRSER